MNKGRTEERESEREGERSQSLFREELRRCSCPQNTPVAQLLSGAQRVEHQLYQLHSLVRHSFACLSEKKARTKRKKMKNANQCTA